MERTRIGVAIACFNRRDKTEACLRALFAAADRVHDTVQLTVVLTDDASSDGTPGMVASCFPAVEILHGSGSLYWAGGMRLALAQLYMQHLDSYLWLNDDTILEADSLQVLLATQRQLRQSTGRDGIIVGSTRGASGALSYGGLRRKPYRFGALSFERMAPGNAPLPCDTHNGNVVLVSADAASRLGNLDPIFQHGMADIDYGLRAKSAGVPVWLMPGYAGTCDFDRQVAGSFLDPALPLRRRWQLISSPKGLPYAPWSVLCRRHAGRLWALHFSWPYTRTILSSLANSALRLRVR